MKFKLKTLLATLTLAACSAQATLIETVGYGIEYQSGVSGFVINDEELGGVTSILRDQAIGSQTAKESRAKVRGDLSTGEVGAKTTLIPTAPTSSLATLASVKLVDTLTFDLTGFAPGNTIDLDIGIDWEGSFFPYVSNRPSSANLQFSLASADDSLSLFRRVFPDTTLLPFVNPDFEAGDALTFGDPGFMTDQGTFIGDWAPFSRNANAFSGLFSLQTGKVTVVNFMLRLNVAGNADFYNSAHLAFDSPVDFTSASGVFMNANAAQLPSSSVPAPMSSWLLLSGLCAIALRRRVISL